MLKITPVGAVREPPLRHSVDYPLIVRAASAPLPLLPWGWPESPPHSARCSPSGARWGRPHPAHWGHWPWALRVSGCRPPAERKPAYGRRSPRSVWMLARMIAPAAAMVPAGRVKILTRWAALKWARPAPRKLSPATTSSAWPVADSARTPVPLAVLPTPSGRWRRSRRCCRHWGRMCRCPQGQAPRTGRAYRSTAQPSPAARACFAV